MSLAGLASSVRLVLLRPRVAENVGAVARAMKNFGLADWVLVDPQVESWERAPVLAVQALDVLEARRTVRSWEDAVRDCAWVVGTTSRPRKGMRRLGAAAFATEAVARAPAGRVALVFGDERSGLTNDELDRCHDVTTLGTDDLQPSVNLAQAVLLYAYELSRARDVVSGRAPPVLPVAATEGELRGVADALRNLLSGSGVLREGERHLVTDLMATLQRARLGRHEARLWNAALRGAAKQADPKSPGNNNDR